MDLSELEMAVLTLVASPGYRPCKVRGLAKMLDLDESRQQELRKSVKKLAKMGRLIFGGNHLVRLAEPAQSLSVVGTFRRCKGGFGFVRPSPLSPTRLEQDVYVSADQAGDAASGDLVLVHLGEGRRRGRRAMPEGRIVDVLERETHRFVGTYFERRGQGWVQVDGTVFSEPILVGDPGAKNAQPNDKAVVEMVRFPSHVRGGEGVIVEVLGPRGQPGVDTLCIIHEFNLPGDFPDDVLEEAHTAAEHFDENDLRHRHDLTSATVVTIDPADARDFDDAISLERLDNGHWKLAVHIADVAHFVRPKSALDREARERGTSVYLPDRVIPMLPEVISNSLASLQPDRVRYTKTVFMEFTEDGARVETSVEASAIRSRRRFSYEEVDSFLLNPRSWKKKLHPDVYALLGRMRELASILRRRRFQRGALTLSLADVKVDLDKHGRVVGAHVVENTESHQLIEEFMLAANEAVADILRRAGVGFLRRVHSMPDVRKLRDLTAFVLELGIHVESLESRFELQRLLELVRGRPEEHAVNYAVLRSLQRAVYGPEDEGHYALASDCYCHFTSPIRRYPDLTIHRLLDLLAAGKRPHQQFDELVVLGAHCSDREQRAESAERELTKVKLLEYLSMRVGMEMDAIVTGVEDYGLFAVGIELPAEGLIQVQSLADDYYQFDRKSHTLTGRRRGNVFRLGDRLRVAVSRVDVDRRLLDFRLVKSVGERARPGAAARGGRRSAAGKARPVHGGGRALRAGNQRPGGKKHRGRSRR